MSNKSIAEQLVSKRYESLLDQGVPTEEAQRVTDAMKDARAIVDAYQSQKARVLEDRDLSPEGKQRRIDEAKAKGQERVVPHQKLAAILDASAKAARAAAISGRMKQTASGWEMEPVKEPDAMSHLAEREIRDRLHGMDSIEVQKRYREAITSGDQLFVRAVENAPRAFRLVPDEVIKDAEEAKLAASPYAPRVAAYESQAQVLSQAVAEVLRDLN